MTEDQIKAIRSLERALKKIKNAGLVLHGMDDTLLVFDRKKLGANESKTDIYKARKDTNHIKIEDSGAYGDSGGW